MKRLWINRQATEDREEWMEKRNAHCERCHDDKDETSQLQEDRIQQQRRPGLEGRLRLRSTKFSRLKMMEIKANGPSDCLLTEMCKNFPWNPFMKLPIGLRKGSQENVGRQRRGQFYVWYFSRSLMRSWRTTSDDLVLLR